MNLRGQILLGSLLLTMLPLVLAVQIIRQGVRDQFAAQDQRLVEEQLVGARRNLDARSALLAMRLDGLAAAVEADNDFRLAVSGLRPDLRPFLLDYAGRAMALMDLDVLLIQDQDGVTLSSGHHPGAFGENHPALPRLLGNAPRGQALLTVRTPDGPLLVLARSRTVALGGRDYHLVGGVKLLDDQLAGLTPGADMAVGLVWSGGALASAPALAERLVPGTPPPEIEYLMRRDGWLVRSEPLVIVDEGRLGEATLMVTNDRASLQRLLGRLDRRIGLVLLAAVIVALLLAAWLAVRLSRPLRDLAARTEDLDLERLDVVFASERRDEVGRLTRLLGDLTRRLADGVSRLRAAEHRATLGEVARQVNHDIRNGITPLRNVLRHLGEVADGEPDRLPAVFDERRQTLEGGLTYLEELAGHYARLGGGRDPRPCRLDEVVAAALTAPPTRDGVTLSHRVPTNLPPVLADPVSLRRIFDNLVRNALESLPPAGGRVAVTAVLEEDPDLEETRILVEVADTGDGIAPEHLGLIFNDFFTTRTGGTGLGLSNVRRLAADCGAAVKVASRPGEGSVFTLSFPLPRA